MQSVREEVHSEPVRRLLTPSFQRCHLLWKGHDLTPTASVSLPTVDLSDQDLTDILIDLYPTLDLVELAILCDNYFTNFELNNVIQWPKLFKHHGFHYNQRLANLLLLISECPKEFKTWAQARKVSPKDLMPLLALKNLEPISSVLKSFADEKPTRSDGKRILDLLVDLILLDKSISDLYPDHETQWLEQLKELRFPHTQKMDQETNLKGFPWPEFCKYSFQRHSDRPEHQVTIRFQSQPEAVERLSRLIDKMEDSSL